MEEPSKAVAEVAKTTGKVVDASRELGGFIAKYIDGTLVEAMGIFEDKLKYMRWERQIRLFERGNHFLAQRGLSQPTRPIPLQIAIPLIQGASLEEDDDLQDRWARLLVNAADAQSGVTIRRAYITILEDITSLDALVLEKIYEVAKVHGEQSEIWTTLLPETATITKPEQEGSNLPKNINVSLGNLARLGLVYSAMALGLSYSCVYITPLGVAFMEAIYSD